MAHVPFDRRIVAVDTGMGGHHRPNSGATDTWLTPPEIIETLGPFDLDPCVAPSMPWRTAFRMLTEADDGFTSLWHDDEFVWCNPPYGTQTWQWLNKLANHPAGGLALIFARTETRGFFAEVWGKADAALFLEGRLHFHHANGDRAAHNAGAPSVIVAYGPEAVRRLELAAQTVDLDGAFVSIRGQVAA